MAKKQVKRGGKALMIVESPAKARTISKFLGDDFMIEASIGHVRDLPEGSKQIPAQYKKEEWAYLGVNVNADFEPVYIIPPGKTEHIRKLRGLVKEASHVYLATDEDREGEAISWHLQELLQPKVPTSRLVFHEITREAIEEALETPRDIDENLVRAQETRRIVDRLYGYEVSPLLWRKVRPRLSAGRVQSVAVRLIVEREKQRMAFVSSTYWDLLATFANRKQESFQSTLVSVAGRRVPAARDFDSNTGQIKDPNLLLLGGDEARALAARIKPGPFKVVSVDEKPYTSKPYPPFTTSTLQQEANRKLGFTARRTMQVAQSLYENGHITYMRTDSTNLANVAVDAARDLVSSLYGGEYLPGEARVYRTKVKNAQEAHEAIRPAGHPFEPPEVLRGTLSADEFRLFEMIWKRTIASQMADARGRRISVVIEGPDGATFQVGGKTIDFPGYLRAYVEGSDDPQAELADQETILPQLEVGETIDCRELEPKDHTTQPPARFNEATLTRTLEEMGIGRPSTYAAIIDTILAREYVVKKGNALMPTWTAFAVSQLLEVHLPKLVDYNFTAKMEDDLDAISRGENGHVAYLNSFYFGDGQIGLKQQLANKVDEIDAREVNRIKLGKANEAEPIGGPIFVRVGRYGPYLEQGDRRASIPEGFPPDELTIQNSLEMLEQATQADEPLGKDPETGKPVYVKVGRFGPYVQLGSPEDEEKPKSASLLRGMKPENIDLPTALKLLSLPRDLGPHETLGEPIMVFNGRFGPYVKCGAETRSLPSGVSPIEVTRQEAIDLLAQPKQQRRGFGAPREPLKTLAESPVTKQPVKIFDGKYGLYATDGTTNASLPKGTEADDVTLEFVLPLLAERAAMGPSAKSKRAAKGAKKAAPKAAKKKAAKKKKVVEE
ncbi:MAG: type I DNA topoisomerase [Planctomycetaceae bacterium]|nr:type I DNA topoisomerase [Planctomycetaceae bacterium]